MKVVNMLLQTFLKRIDILVHISLYKTLIVIELSHFKLFLTKLDRTLFVFNAQIQYRSIYTIMDN